MVCSPFFVKHSWKQGNSWAWAEWRICELCVCQSPNHFFLFQAVCFVSFLPFFLASCRHFSDFTLPRRCPHQWFLLFGVNIQNVSLLYTVCISAITERFCWDCAKHAMMGNDNTDHNARLEREMLSLTLSSCSVCLSPSYEDFLFQIVKCYKKIIIIINYCHTLLTVFWRSWWFIKD